MAHFNELLQLVPNQSFRAFSLTNSSMETDNLHEFSASQGTICQAKLALEHIGAATLK
jgi:hypothetical protein